MESSKNPKSGSQPMKLTPQQQQIMSSLPAVEKNDKIVSSDDTQTKKFVQSPAKPHKQDEHKNTR